MEDIQTAKQLLSEAESEIGRLYAQMELTEDLSQKEALYMRVKKNVGKVKYLTIQISLAERYADSSFMEAIEEGEVFDFQILLQSVGNAQRRVADAIAHLEASNHLRIDNEILQGEVLGYLRELGDKLELLNQTIASKSIHRNIAKDSAVKEWFDENWPEATEKLKEYTSRKALAEMLVPTGIVGAMGLLGAVASTQFGSPVAAGFGTGIFLGMFATGKVGIKEAANRIRPSEDSDDG